MRKTHNTSITRVILVSSLLFSLQAHARQTTETDHQDAPAAEPAGDDGFLQVPGAEYDWFVVEPYGTVLKKVLWEDPRIPVCWDEAPKDLSEERLRGIVKTAILESWQAHANVEFPGWGICSGPRDAGVHIVVRDEMPRTHGIGRYLNKRPGGVVLNFQLSAWRPACQPTDSQEDCIRYLAVHEFGHVLGFVHEHLTTDAPSECRAEAGTRGARGNWKVTKYDPQSIMNYCSKHWTLYSGNPRLAAGQLVSTLSSLDRSAVRKVYGPRNAAVTIAEAP